MSFSNGTYVNPAARRSLVAFLVAILVSYVLYGWDRVAVSVELVSIQSSFHISAVRAGFLSSMFTMGLSFMALPASKAIQKIGMFWSFVVSSLVFSASTVCGGFATSLPLLIASRVVTGIGEAMFSVTLFGFLGSAFPRQRGLMTGLAAAVFGFSLFVGPPAISWIETKSESWRVPLIIIGTIGVAVSLFAMTLRSRVAPLMERQNGHVNEHTSWALKDLGRLLADFRVSCLLICAVIGGTGFYSFLTMFKSYAETHLHLPALTASFILGYFGLGTIVGGVLIGYCLDRVSRTLGLAALLSTSGVLATVMFGSHVTILTASILSFLLGAVMSSIYNNCVALMQDVTLKKDIVFATGLLLTVYYFSASFSGAIFVAAMTLPSPLGSLALYLVPYLFAAMILLLSATVRREVRDI